MAASSKYSVFNTQIQKMEILDLVGRNGSLFVLAEHSECLLVALLRVVVVVHVGQNVTKLLHNFLLDFED